MALGRRLCLNGIGGCRGGGGWSMTTEKGAKHPSWLMALGNAAPTRAPFRFGPFTLGHLVKSVHIWLGPFRFGQVCSHLARPVHIWSGPFTFG